PSNRNISGPRGDLSRRIGNEIACKLPALTAKLQGSVRTAACGYGTIAASSNRVSSGSTIMQTRTKLLTSSPTKTEGGIIMGSMRLAFVTAFLAAMTVPALAQSSYPDRNIRLVFGFPPGVDTAVRLLADKLGEAIGRPVIVENVTGAAGNIAAD